MKSAYNIFYDGISWLCVGKDFQDITKSSYSYATNPQRALSIYLYFVENIDSGISLKLKQSEEGYRCQPV